MLYLICTPIGNLNDFSIRSINTLRDVDFIYAEDTRKSAKLFQHFDIKKKCLAYHEHNESFLADEIINHLHKGLDVAVISDAGAPLISDPGFPLVQACIEEKLMFTVIPGPSSVINAFILAGHPSNQFTFHGFMPRSRAARASAAQELKGSGVSSIFFESSKRITKTIEIFHSFLPADTEISICREMTKIHESIYRGTIAEINQKIINSEIKLLGEFVLVVYSPSSHSNEFVMDERFCKPFLEYLPPSDASKLIAKITEHSKQDVYKYLLSISKSP